MSELRLLTSLTPYPSFVQLESGEVVLRAHAKPAEGRQAPLPLTPV